MEARVSTAERKLNAIEFLLSDRKVCDPKNPYTMVYKHWTIENLQTAMHDIQTEKHDLQTKENTLLQPV